MESNLGTGYIFYKDTNISKKSASYELWKAKDFKKLDKLLDEITKAEEQRTGISKKE